MFFQMFQIIAKNIWTQWYVLYSVYSFYELVNLKLSLKRMTGKRPSLLVLVTSCYWNLILKCNHHQGNTCYISVLPPLHFSHFSFIQLHFMSPRVKLIILLQYVFVFIYYSINRNSNTHLTKLWIALNSTQNSYLIFCKILSICN
jgi:hypothetical protein